MTGPTDQVDRVTHSSAPYGPIAIPGTDKDSSRLAIAMAMAIAIAIL